MRQSLQFFDSAGDGLLNYQGFFQAMTKFNLGIYVHVYMYFICMYMNIYGLLNYQGFSQAVTEVGCKVYMFTYISIYIRVCIYMNICMYVHINIYTHLHL